MLHRKFHKHLYAIYGFVRLADEIVDSFHDYNKSDLLFKFKKDTYSSLEDQISLNPVLNAFQHTVRAYDIDMELIETFLASMEMDLDQTTYDQAQYEQYILGSAQVVGLMCLRVFTEGDKTLYDQLKPAAMALGSAFQKVNFLRDIQADYEVLGRTYFPKVNFKELKSIEKKEIESNIKKDFDLAIEGIKQLPRSSRLGVFTAFTYYRQLFHKICRLPVDRIMLQRIRISNSRKFVLLFRSYFQMNLNWIK